MLKVFGMGAGQSAEVPEGGTEGYHVLKVHETVPRALW